MCLNPFERWQEGKLEDMCWEKRGDGDGDRLQPSLPKQHLENPAFTSFVALTTKSYPRRGQIYAWHL